MKKMLMLVLACIVTVQGCAVTMTTQSEPILPLPIANAAPDFTGTGINGSTVQLSAQRGKVVLLSFWSPTCSACIDEFPAEKQLFAKYQNQPFEMIGICASRTNLSAKLSAKVNEMPWLNVVKESIAIHRLYKVEVVPTFVLVAKDGSIAGRWVGGGQSLTIGAAIDKELAK